MSGWTNEHIEAARARWTSPDVRPLQVTAVLRSMIETNESAPLMLDGLVDFAVVQDITQQTPSDVFSGFRGRAEIPSPIPKARVTVRGEEYLVPMASQAFYPAPPEPGVRQTKKTSDVEAMGMKAVNTSFGPMKSYVVPRAGLHVDWCSWFVVAAPDLLMEALSEISSIGAGRGSGLGVIEKWIFTEIEEDWSMRYQGNPTRPVPSEQGRAMASYRAPYWQRGRGFQAVCEMHDPAGPQPPLLR